MATVPGTAAPVTTASRGYVQVDPPSDLWRLIDERKIIRGRLNTRPAHAPEMPAYYAARVAELHALGFPTTL